VVDSDPVIVERILRNLVSNAVRYTERGRIVVGYRRRGPRLAEAEASGLLLLHKPVPKGKLRAAIANLTKSGGR
jgi:signal transduction histidine kinase